MLQVPGKAAALRAWRMADLLRAALGLDLGSLPVFCGSGEDCYGRLYNIGWRSRSHIPPNRPGTGPDGVRVIEEPNGAQLTANQKEC